MLQVATAPRIAQLAARVRWLDRYRRLVAIAIAAIAAPWWMAAVGDALGDDWPRVHTALLSAMFAVIVWWVVEVGLVYVTALWETQHAALLRAGGLPRAALRRRAR
jgi:hypothetical protein